MRFNELIFVSLFFDWFTIPYLGISVTFLLYLFLLLLRLTGKLKSVIVVGDNLKVLLILSFIFLLDFFSGIFYNGNFAFQKQFLFNIMVAVLILTSKTELRIEVLRRLSSFVIVILTLLFLADIGVVINEEGRMVLGGDNHNYFAVKVVFLMALSTQGSLIRMLFILPATVLVLNVGSRSGLLLLVGVIGVRLFEHRKSLWLYIVLSMGYWIFSDKMNFFISNSVAMKRLMLSIEGSSYGGRDKVLEVFLLILEKSNMFIGMGYAGLSHWVEYYFNVQYWSPHNVFVEVLIRNGLIGLIGLLFLIWIAVKRIQTTTSFLWFTAIIMLFLTAQFYGNKFTFGIMVFYFLTHRNQGHEKGFVSN